MTTIAFRNGIVAADSRCTGAGGLIYPDRPEKAGIIEKHGLIYGFAGPVFRGFHVVRQLTALDRMPWDSGKPFLLEQGEGDEEIEFFVVNHQGRIFQFYSTLWGETRADYIALGSGCVAAMTAMYMGADAERAIEVAAAMDCQTGGSIHTFKVSNLRPPAPPAKRAKRIKRSIASAPDEVPVQPA